VVGGGKEGAGRYFTVGTFRGKARGLTGRRRRVWAKVRACCGGRPGLRMSTGKSKTRSWRAYEMLKKQGMMPVLYRFTR